MELMNFCISTGKYSSFVSNILSLAKERSSSYVCIANVHMFVEAYLDKNLKRIINEADIVSPDGRPLAWALHLLHNIKQDRVAGMDLLPDLLREIMTLNLSVYFYGGSSELLDKTETYLKIKYHDLKIAGLYSPPFKQIMPEAEEKIIKNINTSGANVVFVVLGCPKQEKWMALMKGRINAVMIGIGGALPVMVGMRKRAPKWMQNSGFEWLFRLMQEPGRLFKRYAVTNFLFLFLLLKEYMFRDK
jgi:N-acetylglucosaminyldiphosphoundecaprenol N-acetyl-beta-D-mannosaminyltransferase